ncbi:hypothetical protein STFR1_10364 [Bacillus vallismortis]
MEIHSIFTKRSESGKSWGMDSLKKYWNSGDLVKPDPYVGQKG